MDMKIGTWNVLSLYRAGALRNLIEVFNAYKMDILALQEIRWTGKNLMERRECMVYYSCHEKNHQFETGFIVSNRIKDSVIDFEPIDPRLCKIRLRGRTHNYSIICARAPTEESSEHDKDSFYEKLEGAQDRCPTNDAIIVIGDFNAKVGREDDVKPIIGMNSLHVESNNNGTRLIDYAVSQNMVIGGTKFAHKDIHKATWKSPDGRTTNQINHQLISTRYASHLLDIHSYRGANIDSDLFW